METATSFQSVMQGVTVALEVLGVAALSIGVIYAFVRWGVALVKRVPGVAAYSALRDDLGRSILLALEILVAADIIRTLAVQPSWQNVAVLGLIVLIRTFLSFSLQVEIDGVVPWRRGAAGKRT